MNKKREKGDIGEDFAVKELKKRHHKILERNYAVHDVGEIDIISKQKEYIVFTEVKLRSKDMLYSPREAVNISKQNRIKKTAQLYIMRTKCTLQPRFDVAEVIIEDGGKIINILENAF